MDLPPHRFERIQVGDVELHLVTAGPTDGPLVILTHGFPQTWWSWRYQMTPLVDAGFRVVLVDLRGAGQSEIKGPYNLEQLADDLVGVIDWANPQSGQAILVGHDFGGASSWTAARRAPDKVRALAIVNSCLPERQIEALSTNQDFDQLIRNIYVYAIQIPGVPEWILKLNGAARIAKIVRGASIDQRNFNDANVRPYRDSALREDGLKGMLGPYRDTFKRAWRDLMSSGNPFPDRPRIDKPVLLLWGDEDPVLRYDALVAGSEATVPQIEIVRFPNTGHFAHEEAPQKVNPPLLKFLDRLR